MAVIFNLEQHNIVKCGRCGNLIKYENDEVKGDYDYSPFGTIHFHYVTCPNCNHDIHL